ncbi:hypothetical protein [Clostridium thermobutyricum]|uniref:hypothetical protein n=1 Tax=Clostridium thermobutyricum TaxID=29372 RepID=UPI001FAB4A51|nr:hypothetical protein [Clostridium thermobutyricum]
MLSKDIFELNYFSEEFLKNISYKTNLNYSLNSSLSKFINYDNKDDLFKSIICDLKSAKNFYENLNLINNYNLSFRIKSIESCMEKLSKNICRGNRYINTFNDILGFRLILNEYPTYIPDYFRVVDMRNGKTHDDGYRGIHLYYKLDNYHYPIEIQLNTYKDRLFADLAHQYLYKKAFTLDFCKMVRSDFDKLSSCDENKFKEIIKKYENNNN